MLMKIVLKMFAFGRSKTEPFSQQEGTGKKIVPQVEFVDVGKFLEEWCMDSRQLINSCGALDMIISKVPGTHKGTVLYSWLFSRYLNSTNASFSVFFHDFIFINGQPEKLM